jgi:glycine/D-amino acid oxidase-like deaminating enzyme/nitrite reductase/ring-hydroxylating ferredoxin subunit
MNSLHTSSPHLPSLWELTAEPLSLPRLTESMTVDYCIVGAGIAGLSAAYELAGSGTVAVVDALPVGGGMTGRTTAHISNALDDRYYELEKLLGEEKARLAAQSHTAAISRIAEIVETEKIDCDLERLDGYLFLAPGRDIEELQKEHEAAQRAGLGTGWVAQAPVAGWNTGPVLCFPNQAQFHPIKYLTGLARAIQRRGGQIFTGTRAFSMKGGDLAIVETDEGHIIRARHLIVATNTPVNDRVVVHTKQASYTSSVVVLRCGNGSAPPVLLWDTAQDAENDDSYHYVRTWRRGEEEYLIVGGEDYKTGQSENPDHCFNALENWARARFPGLEHRFCQWSGQVFEPLDGMGFIGHNPVDENNVYIATGDSGNGITHGVIAGMLIRDLILGVPNPWEELYDPGRVSLKMLPRFLRENLNAVAQTKDWITPGDVSEIEDVLPGTGAVIREGIHKVAVFREEDGKYHRLSAVCPHLKCIVHWNPAELSWDCPCHGSRFDARGKVLCGPANCDLERIEEDSLSAALT